MSRFHLYSFWICFGLLSPIDFCFIYVQVESGGNPNVLFKTHPNINKELFSNENILGLKDPNRPFPSGQGDGVGLLKWRMQSTDESVVPLTSKFSLLLRGLSYILVYVLLSSGTFFFRSQLLAFHFWRWHLCQHGVWSITNVWSPKCCYLSAPPGT